MKQNKYIIEESKDAWIKDFFSCSDLKVVALADLLLFKEFDQDVVLSRIREGKLRTINEGNMIFVPASELPGLFPCFTGIEPF